MFNLNWLGKINNCDINEYNKQIDIVRDFGTSLKNSGLELEKISQTEGFQVLFRKSSYLKHSQLKILYAVSFIILWKLNLYKNDNNEVFMNEINDNELINAIKVFPGIFAFVEDNLWQQIYNDIKTEINKDDKKFTKAIISWYFEIEKSGNDYLNWIIFSNGIKRRY